MSMNQERDDEEAPVPGLDRLTRRRAPQRDLWPGIESRIAARPRRRAGFWLAAAACVVAGFAALLSLQMRDLKSADSVGRHTHAAGEASKGLPAYASSKPVLGDDSRAIVEANLALSRQAEREIRQALRQDPESPTLHSLLASAENRQRSLRAML